MKNILVNFITVLTTTIVATFTFISFAQAQTKQRSGFVRPYGLAGCGLGSVVMGKQGLQISAATTNGTSFNQMFGITAGTLNCVDSPSAEVASRMDQFILVNRSQLQGDIARGNGETILALGSYMGCSHSSQLIGAQLKANYSNIFDTNQSEIKANEITDGIISVILDSPELAQQCNNLG